MPEPTTSSNKLLNKLKGGDRRSIGQSNTVAMLVRERPALFSQLMKRLWDSSALIRMRAADAAEKLSFERPDRLQPCKTKLLRMLDEASEQELRWRLAQMIPRLHRSKKDRVRAAAVLGIYWSAQSSMVKTCARQAMADLRSQDDAPMRETKERLTTLTQVGTAARRARGRKLLPQLERNRRGQIRRTTS
jgi:hypothetical protein